MLYFGWVSPIGELAVIGQDQESFRIHIQSSNRQHMTAKLRAAIKNGWSSLGIAGGRQISDGLVEHVEQILVLYGNLFAIDCDFIHGGKTFTPSSQLDVAVDGDAALGGHGLCSGVWMQHHSLPYISAIESVPLYSSSI